MDTSIDKFGRVVIPKAIRDRLGITPGQRLRIVERPDGVVLFVDEEGAVLRYEDGVLVHDGAVEGDLGAAVRNDREARRRRKSGL